MCPPARARHGAEGVSHLYRFWVYQLQHGAQLRACFPCFKAAFLEFKDLLESAEDWDDQDWDPESDASPSPWEESEPAAVLGLGLGPGGGPPAPEDWMAWNPGLLASGLEDLDQDGAEHFFVPTELEPQDARPLDLGPEDADWTQSLPWRFRMLHSCPHWPVSPPSWMGFFPVDLYPGEPMLLKLGTAQPMVLAEAEAEAEAWLLGLQFFTLVTYNQAIYFRKMRPKCVHKMPGPTWIVLLDPAEVCLMRLKEATHEFDVHKWKLSVLESSSVGDSAELLPADSTLLKRGFIILSYTSAQQEAEEEDLALRS